MTVIGISIGILSVVIITIIGDLGKQMLNKELSSMGISGITIKRSDENGTVLLNEKELEEIQKTKNVTAATPLMTGVSTISVRNKTSQCILWGVDYNAADIVSLELLYGRMIRKSDVKQKQNVCIVDEAFAKQTYHRNNVVGKTVDVIINGKTQTFNIIGVVKSGGNLLQGLMGDIVPTFMYAPFSTISELSKQNGFTQIVAKIDESLPESVTTSSIVHNLDVGKNEKISFESLNKQKDKLNGILDIATLVLSCIGGISLLVAGLSIMTVMLVTVNERTREIGIKKAIGASRKIILLEFLSESLILSLLGSILGTTTGVLLGYIGTKIFKMTFTFNIFAIIICIIFCVLV
ncbi:MAG: ABC transporter permease, partial [Oscillospiraceae bacterium]